MRRSTPDHNPNRTGGRNLWTDQEMRTLEDGFDGLVTRLPGRGTSAIARKLMHLAEVRDQDGEEEA